MAKYDESDGVLRTIGGKRIFIKNGESLSSAMKRSGKFKSPGERASREDKERTERYKKEDTERDDKTKEEMIQEAKEIMNDMRYLDSEEEGYDEALSDIKERYADLRIRENGQPGYQSKQSKEIEEALKNFEGDKSEDKLAKEVAKIESRMSDADKKLLEREKMMSEKIGSTEDRENLQSKAATVRMNKVRIEQGAEKLKATESGDWDKYTKEHSSDAVYKAAFADYKKEHPNTKMTLAKFIKWSEGGD